MRGDRGGENRDVSILMILLRGSNRASFMWGPSVFNTRIEHLWVEVGRRFVRQWRDEWNAHPLSGAIGGHSPNVSYLMIYHIKYFT